MLTKLSIELTRAGRMIQDFLSAITNWRQRSMVVLVEFMSKKYPKEPYDAQKIGRVQRRKISINQHSEEIELYYGYTACDWYWKLPARPSLYDHSSLKARRQETRMSVVKFGGVSTAGSETTKSVITSAEKKNWFSLPKSGISIYSLLHLNKMTTRNRKMNGATF